MVSVTSALRYHPRYQSRSSMYIRGLIPHGFGQGSSDCLIKHQFDKTNANMLLSLDNVLISLLQ